MTSRITQIQVLLKEIENMKRIILRVDSDISLPYVVKTEKLEQMRRALFVAEHYALRLMEDEVTHKKAS